MVGVVGVLHGRGWSPSGFVWFTGGFSFLTSNKQASIARGPEIAIPRALVGGATVHCPLLVFAASRMAQTPTELWPMAAPLASLGAVLGARS